MNFGKPNKHSVSYSKLIKCNVKVQEALQKFLDAVPEDWKEIGYCLPEQEIIAFDKDGLGTYIASSATFSGVEAYTDTLKRACDDLRPEVLVILVEATRSAATITAKKIKNVVAFIQTRRQQYAVLYWPISDGEKPVLGVPEIAPSESFLPTLKGLIQDVEGDQPEKVSWVSQEIPLECVVKESEKVMQGKVLQNDLISLESEFHPNDRFSFVSSYVPRNTGKVVSAVFTADLSKKTLEVFAETRSDKTTSIRLVLHESLREALKECLLRIGPVDQN